MAFFSIYTTNIHYKNNIYYTLMPHKVDKKPINVREFLYFLIKCIYDKEKDFIFRSKHRLRAQNDKTSNNGGCRD